MKQVIQDWWQGFHLLVRICILLLCIAVGWCFPVLVQFALSHAGMHVPIPVMFLFYVLYVVGFCPFLMVSWARWCGYVKEPKI
jgi:hypothetical protein